jgi:hypothetical protein
MSNLDDAFDGLERTRQMLHEACEIQERINRMIMDSVRGLSPDEAKSRISALMGEFEILNWGEFQGGEGI